MIDLILMNRTASLNCARNNASVSIYRGLFLKISIFLPMELPEKNVEIVFCQKSDQKSHTA
jgi:hypothetical protein